MTYEQVKRDWVTGNIVTEVDIDVFGTKLLLSKSDGIGFNVYRFFMGGGSYQVSVDKSEKTLKDCVEHMVSMSIKYA